MKNDQWTAISAYRSGFISSPSTYYEILDPKEWSTGATVMMITGGVHSGACYLVTPDGRPGWAHAFLRHGYRVVLVDWPGVGRSGYVAAGDLCGDLIVAGLGQVLQLIGQPAIVMTHSISGAFGWKLLELHPGLVSRLVGIAPASPGNMGKRLGRLISEKGDSRIVEMPSGVTELRLDAEQRLDREFAEKKLVGDGHHFPMKALDSYYNSLQPISDRVVYERTNLGDSQLKVTDFRGYAGKRIAVVTGSADIDHPRKLDAEIVDWLNAHGALASHVYLDDLGLERNGHMMMLEDNSDEVASEIVKWLQREG